MSRRCFPKVLIFELLAAMRLEVRGQQRSVEEAGNTLSSAPESIRKYFPECLSKIEMVDEAEENGACAVAIDDRPWVDRR